MNRILRAFSNYRALLRERGIKFALKELLHRLTNRWYDYRLGIRTIGRVQLTDIGITREDSRDSMPIGYRAFFSVLKRLPLDKGGSTFLDFGVGKGRAVCAAATFGFRRIIGIELSELLVESACANLRGMKKRKTGNVDIQLGDATRFAVPHDANVIYFFNPFAGETLRTVVENVRCSYEAAPRKMYIIFFNNDHFEKIIGREAWLTKSYATEFYPSISCGVYETRLNEQQPTGVTTA